MTINPAEASDMLSQKQDSMHGMYLTFKLADEEYGLEIRYVTEIIGIQPITNVPDMPEHMIGVLNLRGSVIPIIDVRLRFGLRQREFDDRTCIIVVDVNGVSMGLVVDEVNEVISIPDTDIEPPPRTNHTTRHPSIQGMGKLNEQVKIILDVRQLIENEELDRQQAGIAAD